MHSSPNRVDRISMNGSDYGRPPAFVSIMRTLQASPEPAVVFTSLAALCVPTLSDECHITIEEGNDVRYRIRYPLARRGSSSAPPVGYPSHSVSAAQLVTGQSVSTPILAPVLTGQKDYRGSVVHRWNFGYQPTPTDAAFVQLLVERAVALIHQERLTYCLGLQSAEVEQLKVALATNREIGTAVGILMSRHGLTQPHAFDLLRCISQHRKCKLSDLAADVVNTGRLSAGRSALGTTSPGAADNIIDHQKLTGMERENDAGDFGSD